MAQSAVEDQKEPPGQCPVPRPSPSRRPRAAWPVASLSFLTEQESTGFSRWLRTMLWVAVLAIVATIWGVRPGAAQPTPATVTVNKVVTTGSDDNSAFNGDTIAYTIIVNNGTSVTLKDMLILDVLPVNVLDEVKCLDAVNTAPCGLIVEETTIPEPLGGTITVTTTRQISWTVASLAPNTSLQRSFTARVIGQADGATFTNVAYVSYDQNGSLRTQASNEVPLTVRLRIDQGGTTTLSDSPTWFSQDAGGTLSMDWADFDGDGDLDLALGSTLGISIYRNVAGSLQLFWTIARVTGDRPAFGVRWADVDGDRVPEVIAVGAVTGNSASGNLAQLAGINYVYQYDPTTGATDRRFTELSNFATDKQMVRVEAGDFSGDGAVDLVVSTNAINADCPVQLWVNDGGGVFSEAASCVSRSASAALKPVDFDKDGDLDLTAGLFPSQVQMLVNNNGTLGGTTVTIESSVTFLPYDFTWGDYDGDGYLDLAAAYPLMREARIYRNLSGTGFASPISLRTNVFLTPYALDWGDFSGDGKLDLAIADSPPIIYTYTGGDSSSAFTPFFVLGDDVISGQVWALRAVDVNNDGDIDLTLSDRDGPSLVISNFRPPLNTTRATIAGASPFTTQSPSSSVVWGDADGDDDLDIVFGAGPASSGPAALNTKVYYNDFGDFPAESARSYSGFGPHSVAMGDSDFNRDLDAAVGTTTEIRVYHANDFLAPFWSYALEGDKVLVWGDVDGDVDLDLLVAASFGSIGEVALFINDGTGNLGTEPGWRVTTGSPQSVAWGDFDGDGFLDFALGIDGANRIYRNERDNRFSLFWTAPVEDNTRAVAWGDYDADGDLDLAVGNFGSVSGAGEANLLYENRLFALGRSFVPVLATTETFHTTALDWGDWDNDGDQDLAVGNHGEKDQILVNSGSASGAPQLLWLWSSAETLNTTGVAWGDREGDGDLDLAISQDGAALNGVYVNNLVVPTHLSAAGGGPTLINPPLYVYTTRPGTTPPAYAYSSAEILSGPGQGPVTVGYRLFNPTTQNGAGSTGAIAAPVLSIKHQFSVDGGGTWRNATPMTATLTPVTDNLGIGLQGTFLWDAVKDQAIGDNARFRIQIIQTESSGPVQRATAAVVSPPFRVRAITCVWPEDPQVRALPSVGTAGDGYDIAVDPYTTIRFTGKIAAGTGSIYFTWDFGDGSTAAGQVVQRSFTDGTYTLRMAAIGDPCPQSRERAITVILKVGTGQTSVKLPFVSVAETGTSTEPETDGAATAQTATTAMPPPQVAVLDGDVQGDSGAVWLRWAAPAVDIDGYRVYRGHRDSDTAARVAVVPPDSTAYQDADAGCDLRYYVTTVAAGVESLPSAAVYYTPLCASSGR